MEQSTQLLNRVIIRHCLSLLLDHGAAVKVMIAQNVTQEVISQTTAQTAWLGTKHAKKNVLNLIRLQRDTISLLEKRPTARIVPKI